MAKSFLYRLFGIGRVPPALRPTLESEGLLLLEEGLGGSVTYKRLRGPGKYFLFRKVRFTGSLAVTRRRLVAFAFRRKVVDVGHDDPRRQQLTLEAEGGSSFLIGFDASLFREGYSGGIALRFKTEKASELLDVLQKMSGH